MKKLNFLTSILVISIISFTVVYSADANLKVNYQGFLRLSGAPVSGTKGFIFRIKNGSGVTQWESACTNIVVSSGIFRTVLGENNGVGNWDTINWKGIDAFLEVARIGDMDTCNNYTAITSSERVMAIPYSILASTTSALMSVSEKLKVDSSTVSVNGADRYFVPKSVIAMWSGLLANIPEGWALCDGTNGTPNLQSKFVYGVATGVNPGAAGGAANHTHTVSAHTHDADIAPFASGAVNNGRDCRAGSTAPLGNHSHTVDPPNTTSSSESPATSSTGNLPPYYKLAYIMKL